MKIDRLLGILIILLREDIVTAPKLAERFEVSRRTINRDIEDLCKAGIPVVTLPGAGGGICIAEGYKIDKTVLTTKEMQAVLTGLQSLESVSDTNEYRLLMEKLIPQKQSGKKDLYSAEEHVIIDLSSHYKEKLSGIIAGIKEAMGQGRRVTFDYYAVSGEGRRVVEPCLLIFHWRSWYLYGYCCTRQDYRLFKLQRMEGLEMTEEMFEKRAFPMPDLDIDRMYHDEIIIKAIFDKSQKWKLIDEYGIGSFQETETGLYFERFFSNQENLMSWLLSFGANVEVLEPQNIKEKYTEEVKKMLLRYFPLNN